MEQKVGKNEFINQVLLKIDEGKVFLSKNGIKIKTKLDDVRIGSDGVSVTLSDVYIRMTYNRSMSINEIMIMDLVKNEVYVHEYGEDPIKVEVLPDVFYIKMKIPELKPISLEALLRTIEALQIPYAKRELNRIDVDVTKCNGIQYTTDDGLQIAWGDTWNDHELRITRDAIIYDGLVIDISNNSYFITFEKGIMSVML